MKHISYTNEINKILDSKIYYKAEPQVEVLDLTKYYKIKNSYINSETNTHLLEIFTNTLKPPLLCKEVCTYLHNNYYQPDTYIYTGLLLLILQVMPDLNEQTYISDIKKYVE